MNIDTLINFFFIYDVFREIQLKGDFCACVERVGVVVKKAELRWGEKRGGAIELITKQHAIGIKYVIAPLYV